MIPAAPALFFTLVAVPLLLQGAAPPQPPESDQSCPSLIIARYRACLLLYGVPATRLVLRPDPTPVCPGSAQSRAWYDRVNYQWPQLPLIPAVSPLAYLVPRSTAQVQAGVRCAHALGIRVVPKSGGHGLWKYELGDNSTVVIDLGRMNGIRFVDNSSSVAPRVEIGPGLLMGEVNSFLYTNGRRTLPTGTCVTVGMAYGLGGGYGQLSRFYGTNSDHMLELDVVTADGELLTVSDTDSNPHSDLFWVLRGGSAGSFGIVTRWLYRSLPAPRVLVQGIKVYSIQQYVGVLAAWQAFARSDPGREISAKMVTTWQGKENVIQLYMEHTTNDWTEDPAAAEVNGRAEVERYLAGFPNKTFNNTGTTIRVFPNWLDFVVTVNNEENGAISYVADKAGLAKLSRHNVNPNKLITYSKSYLAPSDAVAGAPPPTKEGLRRMYEKHTARPRELTTFTKLYGGRMNAKRAKATAFVHRARVLYEEEMSFHTTDRGRIEPGLRWMFEYFALTREVLRHRESFQNHLDGLLPDYLREYYGENLPRLIRVKGKYDPDNVFHNPQSIPLV